MANYLDPYASELQGIQRQQEMAKMLLQQGQQQPQEQMVSGRVAPINPLQAFLPALNTYQGMNLQKNAESEQKKLADLIRGETNTKNEEIINAMLGKDYQPAIAPEIQRDDMGNVMPNVQEQSGMKADPRLALALALKSGTQFGEGLAPTLLTQLTKPNERVKLAQGESYGEVDKSGAFKPIYTNPKEVTPTELQKDYEYVVKNFGYKGSPLDFKKELALASRPVTNVTTNVMPEQKIFENTQKLRSEFKSEPIYKAQQEVQTAYQQVVDGLEKKSPAGDLAAATKFMKLLDPGSVVRESELALAMKAGGALDRLYNYADQVASGTKLTEKQRQDFKELSTSFFNTSSNLYNQKRNEYVGTANRYGFNPSDVTGDAINLKTNASPPQYAKNPNTNERIVSTDGGKTWSQAK
jgi:hypothetical protein